MSPRGRAATFTWSGGLSSVAVAGGLALGTGDRGSELAAVLQQLEGPSPTGGGPDPAGVSRPGGAGSDPGRAAGRWPCPLGAAAGWPRCAAAPWRSPGVWVGRAAVVAGGLALGAGDRGGELAAVLQPLEGPSPTGGGPDPAGVSGPGGAGSDPGRAAGRWPCPPEAAAGWPRCAAAPWERVIEGGARCSAATARGPPPTGDDADQAGASRPVASRVVRS